MWEAKSHGSKDSGVQRARPLSAAGAGGVCEL